MKKLTGICGRCMKCKYRKKETCAGLIDYRRQDCPEWFTTRLVPERYGDVLVRTSQGRPL